MWAAGAAGVLVGMVFQTALNKVASPTPTRPSPSPTSPATSPRAVESAGAPSPALSHPAAAFGLPSDGNLRAMEGYVSSVNYERRIPNWVVEFLQKNPSDTTSTAESKSSSGGKAKKGSSASSSSAAEDEDDGSAAVSREGINFFSDPAIPALFRSQNGDYAAMGLSRGHLAAAQFHKGTQQEMNETFNLSANVVPQDMTMNACDWYRLESMTKKLVKDFPKGLFVVTGPLFVPTYDMQSGQRTVHYQVGGNNEVAVPTHMFKVLMGVKDDDSKAVAAFVMPNEPILDERPLTAFQVPVKYVEQLTGLQMFPKAPGVSGAGASNTNTAPATSGWLSTPPAVYDMCKKHKCEGSYASFSRGFRHLGRIRAAKSVVEAEQALQQIAAAGVPIDARMKKEFDKKLADLNKKKPQ